MEKNSQKKKQQERKCQKFFRAISIGSPIQTIRRISNRSESPSPAKPSASTRNPVFRNIDIQTKPISLKPVSKPVGEPVQIDFDYSKPYVTDIYGHGPIAKLGSKIEPVQHASVAGKKTDNALGAKLSSSKAEPAKNQVKNLESKKSSGGMQMEERFTNYINRAKLKIRAMTNVGDIMKTDTSETEGPDTKDGNKDQYSEYIRRAKMKIRMTSSMGGASRRNGSFKYFED